MLAFDTDMNIKVVSSILFSVLAGVYASPSAPTGTTGTTGTAVGGAPSTKPQVFMDIHMKVGPIDMDALAGGRLQPNGTSTTPTGPAKKAKWTPPPGKLYRPRDDPSIRDLIGVGSPEENAKFEAEAAILFRARGDDDPKIVEKRAWFKNEKQRRRDILNKRNGTPTATTPQVTPAQVPVQAPVSEAAPAPVPVSRPPPPPGPAPAPRSAPPPSANKISSALGMLKRAGGTASNRLGRGRGGARK